MPRMPVAPLKVSVSRIIVCSSQNLVQTDKPQSPTLRAAPSESLHLKIPFLSLTDVDLSLPELSS